MHRGDTGAELVTTMKGKEVINLRESGRDNPGGVGVRKGKGRNDVIMCNLKKKEEEKEKKGRREEKKEKRTEERKLNFILSDFWLRSKRNFRLYKGILTVYLIHT